MHTPEPWAVGVTHLDDDGCYPETAITALGNKAAVAVALDFGENNPSMREANARRVVACVNACKGFDTSLLEKISLKPYQVDERERVCAYVEDIEAQRDELLAMAYELLPYVEEADCAIYKKGVIPNLVSKIKKLIAKCEKP